MDVPPMMPSSATTPRRLGVLALLLLGCGEPFTPSETCLAGCPLPPTVPPVVKFLLPAPGDTVDEESIIAAAASDDRRVTGVQFYVSWIKLHPYLIPAGPYRIVLGAYRHGWPACPTPILLQVVALDVEGNADTAKVGVMFVPIDYDPLNCP